VYSPFILFISSSSSLASLSFLNLAAFSSASFLAFNALAFFLASFSCNYFKRRSAFNSIADFFLFETTFLGISFFVFNK
jgi:hypothetical protein